MNHSKHLLTFLVGITMSAASALAHPGHGDTSAPPPSRTVNAITASTRPANLFAVIQPVLADGDLPAALVTIDVKEGFRYISSNGLPDHTPGEFPNRGNPNSIRAQQYQFRVPASPRPAAQPTPLRMQPFGVATNGVPFDPGTAEVWGERRLGWSLEAFGGPMNLGLDTHNAHVQPNGAYHYHALPIGLYERVAGKGKSKKMALVGWAADGYPIYGLFAYAKADDATSELKELRSSWRLKTEDRAGGEAGPGGKPDGRYTKDWEYAAGTGDLDEFNGRTGVTPEFPNGTYYYMITDQFPFIPRMFKGTPDASFQRKGPGGRPGGPGAPEVGGAPGR